MDKDGDTQQTEPKQQEATGWQYTPGGGTGTADAATSSAPSGGAPAGGTSVEWSASEFVAHDKGASWYVLLSGATIVVAAILYLVTRDRFTVGIVVVMGAVLAIAAASKPRVLTCRLDAKGIVLGTKRYPYAQYKSFTVQEEGPFASIVLLPMKRFGLPLSMYLAPDIEHKALEVLSSYLPLEPGKPDMLDRLMRYLRF